MVHQMNVNDFRGGSRWCKRFMKIKKTKQLLCKQGQWLPTGWQNRKQSFLKYVMHIIDNKEILPSQARNMKCH